METTKRKIINIRATIHAPVEKIWKLWTDPVHIVHWNNASEDWHTPKAENDLRAGGKFLSRMESRDGSQGFDFVGEYNKVELYRQIAYTLEDGRNVQVSFSAEGENTTVRESFEAEDTNPAEMQQSGWQAILDNFSKYAEAYGRMEKLHFEINISAKAGNVYETMLDKKHYTTWTAEFNPTSHFEGSWEKGAKILFLGTDQDGNFGGMVSRIKENIPGEFVSIEHQGIIRNGEEITSGAEVEGWAGIQENYTFTQTGGTTLLSVDVDSNTGFAAYFREIWPKALNTLKIICEGEAKRV